MATAIQKHTESRNYLPIIQLLLPFLLVITLVSSILFIYLGSVVNLYSIFALLACAGMFLVCDRIKKSRKLGFLYFVLLVIGVSAAEYAVMSFEINKLGFIEWFLSGGIAVENTASYLLATIIGFAFFISASVFYFSRVIYRSSVLALVSLIPCALFIKTAASMPTAYIAVIAALNLFLFIVAGRSELGKKNNIIGRNISVVAYVDFGIAAVLLALIIPKPESTPFYDKFESLVARYSIGGSDTRLRGKFTRYSGNADNYLNMESKLLYLVSTDDPEYLTIQSFDSYDTLGRYWVYTDISSQGFRGWSDDANNMSLGKLAYILRSNGAEIPDILYDKVYDEQRSRAIVKAVDFPSSFTIAPLRVTDIYFPDGSATTSYRTPAGEFFTDVDYLDGNASYSLNYYDGDFLIDSGWVNSGMCNLSFDEYGELLDEIRDSFEYDDESYIYEIASAFCNDYDTAKHYSAANYEAVSSEIRMLSAEITKNCLYDYQKAAAIERYFQSGDFTYSLAFKAPEELDTPEYFLSTSKTGTCSDFATAYCLLARSAGLHVRYNEGFTMQPTNTGGLYEILTENAHAYPQVYIPGAGWINYEPTVKATEAEAGDTENENKAPDYLAIFLTSVVIIISLVVIILMIVLTPKAAELLFRIRCRLKDSNKAVIMLYNRFSSRAEKYIFTATAALTADQLGEAVSACTGLSADSLIKPFVRCCYGNEALTTEEKTAAIRCYAAQMKLLKKYRRRHKRISSKKQG